MTHLPFIAASYVIAIGLPVAYALSAARRLKLVRKRLSVLDPRALKQ